MIEVVKQKNCYLLRSPLHYLLKHCTNEKEIQEIRTRDIDTCYSENGHAMLKPYQMSEKPYLVVKSILDRQGNHQKYEIKLGDKLKLGRATLLVREINIVKRLDREDEIRDRVIRLRSAYERTKNNKQDRLEEESDAPE